ncbi:hypothetical protein QBC44DRAFT_256273 [Cladorrhinum sp. PSN332]|nr:hypothetical protein QBC44DRAFT_256273 [Cladorrhinum sp. PSN332]
MSNSTTEDASPSKETDNPCRAESLTDADVAGIGVLISFGVSVLFSMIVILIAYFRRCLRHDVYNSVDDYILSLFRFKAPIPSADSPEGPVLSERTAIFESFFQSIADQQLFTGFALVIAVYLVRYGFGGLDSKISAYSYAMACNLALVSCLAHLSTITILRSHLTTPTREVRVFLIVATFGLLVPHFVAGQKLFMWDESASNVRCGMQDWEKNPHRLSYSFDPTSFFAILTRLVCIVYGYARRLLELYFPLFNTSSEAWLAEGCNRAIGWPSKRRLEELVTKAQDHQARQVVALGDQQVHVVVQFTRVFRIIAVELNRSFFAEIIWLLFYTTLGFGQVGFILKLSYHWYSSANPSDGPVPPPISFVLGFGQILPLVLLWLPFLSAFDLYTELRKFNSKRAADQVQHLHVVGNMNLILDTKQHTEEPRISRHHLSVFNSCLELQPKFTAWITALASFIYLLTAFLVAFTLTELPWFLVAIETWRKLGDDSENSREKIDAIFNTELPVLLFLFGLFSLFYLISALSSFAWIFRGRYAQPFKAPSFVIETEDLTAQRPDV